MQGKLDQTVSKDQLNATYKRWENVLSALADMVSKSSANQESRQEYLIALDQIIIHFDSFLPASCELSKKEGYEFKEVVESIKKTKPRLSNDEALLKTLELKTKLQDFKDDKKEMDEALEAFQELAVDEYELDLTNAHMKEALRILKRYRELTVAFYFKNDPFAQGKLLFEKLQEVADRLDIDLQTTQFFEETLLKMAGITTKPSSCDFDYSDPDFFLIRFQGINQEEADRLLAYLRVLMKDENAFYEPVMGKPGRFPNLQYAVNMKKTKECLPPAFDSFVAELEKDNKPAKKMRSDRPFFSGIKEDAKSGVTVSPDNQR